jgi:hypothetical protein
MADANEDPFETAERVADYVERDSDTLGRAEVSQVNLPVGQSYFVAWDSRALEGEFTDDRMLVYGTSHDGYGYQFIFVLPKVEGSYESDADYIARSFRWTASAA